MEVGEAHQKISSGNERHLFRVSLAVPQHESRRRGQVAVYTINPSDIRTLRREEERRRDDYLRHGLGLPPILVGTYTSLIGLGQLQEDVEQAVEDYMTVQIANLEGVR